MIAIFPSSRRTGLVRSTARSFLASRTPAEASEAWRRPLDELASEMRTLGIPPDAIDRELAAFAGAVEAEFARRVRRESGRAS